MTTVLVKTYWNDEWVTTRHFRTWHERSDPYQFAGPHIAHLRKMGFTVKVEEYKVGVGRVV